MGYEDRDYMRTTGAGGGEGRSNPLWWILGLIALILLVAFFRRGSTSGGRLQALREAAEDGPIQTCRIELSAGPEQTTRLVPMLRDFFHERGYDSTIHETADATETSASFMRQSEDLLWVQNAVYQHVRPGHKTRKARHTLVFHVHGGAADESPYLEESAEVSRQLRMRLEAEFPGIVAKIDNTPQPVAYDDYE